CCDDLIAVSLKCLASDRKDVRLVINEQDQFSGGHRNGALVEIDGLDGAPQIWFGGKVDPERAPIAGFTKNVDESSVTPNDREGGRQPQPRAFAQGFSRKEGFEDPL